MLLTVLLTLAVVCQKLFRYITESLYYHVTRSSYFGKLKIKKSTKFGATYLAPISVKLIKFTGIDKILTVYLNFICQATFLNFEEYSTRSRLTQLNSKG